MPYANFYMLSIFLFSIIYEVIRELSYISISNDNNKKKKF